MNRKNVKKMKALTAKLIDVAGKIFRWAMLAIVAMLCVGFIRRYIAAVVWSSAIFIRLIFNCAYARKSVVNRMVHDRNYAVFTINPDSGQVIREMKTKASGYDGDQRGLLKDNYNINIELIIKIMGRKLFYLKSMAIVAVLTLVAFLGFNKLKAEVNPIVNPKLAVQNWYYIPNTPPSGSAIYTVGNYTSTAPPNCGGPSTVPCQISFTEGPNYTTLTQYLAYQSAHGLPVNIINRKIL